MNSLACYVYNATTYCDEQSGAPPTSVSAFTWVMVGFMAGFAVEAVLYVGEKVTGIIDCLRRREHRDWNRLT